MKRLLFLAAFPPMSTIGIGIMSRQIVTVVTGQAPTAL
jgi:hypothetical protein